MRFLGILLLSVLIVAMFSAAVSGQSTTVGGSAPAAVTAPTPAPPPSPHPLSMPGVRIICPSLVLALPANLASGALMNYIGVTDDQKPKIADAQDKFQTKLTGLTTTLQAATKQLVEAIVAGDATPDKLKELSGSASKAEADVLQARVEFWATLKTLLTADQYKKLANQPLARIEAPVMPGFGPHIVPRTSEAPGTPPPAALPSAAPTAPKP